MLIENFLKLTPKGDQSGRGLRIFGPLKETIKQVISKYLLHFFACNSKRDLEG